MAAGQEVARMEGVHAASDPVHARGAGATRRF